MTCFPAPLGDNMKIIEFFRNRWKKEPVIPVPKCTRCGLKASYEMVTSFKHRIEVIEFRLCEDCMAEYNAMYNSRWIQPPKKKEE